MSADRIEAGPGVAFFAEGDGLIVARCTDDRVRAAVRAAIFDLRNVLPMYLHADIMAWLATREGKS